MTNRPTQLDPKDCISIIGARENNLKNISVNIPRNQFVVITGVSGSGKSTLAFDIIFAEGQRRFLDAMSAYARQFVEQLARPDVDQISGLPPTVSIEQQNSRGGGKSTVATVTEAFHFLRLLFARLGTQHCPDCHVPVQAQTRDELGSKVLAELKTQGEVTLLAPVVRNRKGFHSEVAQWAAKQGYAQIRADGKFYNTSEPFKLDRFREHDIEIVIGALTKEFLKDRSNVQFLVDQTLKIGEGTLYTVAKGRKHTVYSTERACPDCGRSFGALDPKMFSYNSSQGWCEECRGFGETFYLPEVDRGARADAIEESWFEWQEGKREKCSSCKGARLNAVARAVRLHFGGSAKYKPIKKYTDGLASEFPGVDFFNQSTVAEALEYFTSLKMEGREAQIARDILPEIIERLKFLGEVGLDYLQLGRSVTTLSGGEAQRIRLAAQLGSNLSGVLYVLDEPTIGLHARDNDHLLRALQLLKNRGNSLLVVEHDEDTMRQADYVIDLGPGAGVKGGEVAAVGTLAELMANPKSITGTSLSTPHKYPSSGKRREVRKGKTAVLTLKKANTNNLKNLTVTFPLNRLVVVTGVSGSGKSTLVRECLVPALEETLRKGGSPAPNLVGAESLKAVYEVTQSPVGRTPRSTPATYVGFFDSIRQLFAQTPEARVRGYSPSRFSFNSSQGRCPECEGAGKIKLEMNFLPSTYVTCESCQGCRYNRETLDIQFHGLNIAQVLNLDVSEALEFFSAIGKVRRPLEALRDTGLDYLKLGQISPTLSGGEAQRMKLVAHLLTGLKERSDLLGQSTKGNIFILEEPTIGLHIKDVRRLIEVLQKLVNAGHTVIVIEHNLDLIAEADWLIDLGPEAGEAGGQIVAEGTPEQVAKVEKSYTGRYLKKSGMLAAP